ncbi:MAG TPA: exopolysaccharide biosynthesis protein [Cyanobacteria bacterium UBA12227]|nr:exopolysaccharide biosynthesis protein [Cyanobacteria bacterium UBA12227]HAX86013.1 exopolysaccharide biosynthesis protein [Cyanobacteria bacterium UBA11370]HBY78897.1 exopolysaccharide biosynthesis protein [Cyanobacteria bacterium UBA11148]
MHLKFSQDLESLLKRLATHPLTLKDVLAETSERGFSLLISLLVLPFLVPMPPGLSTLLSLGCLLLSGQMALGRRTPWLPAKISRIKFPQGLSRQLLKNIRRITRLLEKIVRPRWLWIAEKPQIWRWNGFCIAWLTVLLMLPIPFTNPIPTLGILLLAIATLEEDGLLMCVSYGITALITLFFGSIAYVLLQAPDWLPNLLS